MGRNDKMSKRVKRKIVQFSKKNVKEGKPPIPQLVQDMHFLCKHSPHDMDRPFTYYELEGSLSSQTGVEIVFTKPQNIIDLDIGYTEENFRGDDLNTPYPFSVDELCSEIKHTTIGVEAGREIEFSVPNSQCKVYMVININGIYCKLNTNEWDERWNYGNLKPSEQLALFQRLLNQQQITFQDLEAADIDTWVYKRLCLNEEMGQQLYEEKMNKVMSWIQEQQVNPELNAKYTSFMRAIEKE